MAVPSKGDDILKKNENDFKISVSYRGKVYLFDYGSQAYIFHTGIYNDIPKKYGLKGLREYTNLVHTCYVEDSNRTPLGELSDYVAQRWKKMRKMHTDEILAEFYNYAM